MKGGMVGSKHLPGNGEKDAAGEGTSNYCYLLEERLLKSWVNWEKLAYGK